MKRNMLSRHKNIRRKINIKLIKDFFYNAVAALLPVAVLQVIVLPYISARMNSEAYGLALTMISAIALLPSGLGNVLNNVHLLESSNYKREEKSGDIGLLLCAALVLSTIGILGLSFYYNIYNGYEVILIFAAAILTLVKEYYIVFFWIDLDYKKILISNVWLIVGYLLGMFTINVHGKWEYIYILGQLLSILYIYHNYGIDRRWFHVTDRFRIILHKSSFLVITTILNRSLQYIDRLLLYPLLGGTEVTIYYISTLTGKIISMGMAPVNSFLLSQLAKKDKMSKMMFLKILGISGAVGAAGYLGCIIITAPVLNFLYPRWAQEAMQYVYVTTLTAVMSAMSIVISPILLRFCNVNWQVVISGVCFVVYLVVSLTLLSAYGLWGFCIGGLISNLVTVVMMVVVYLLTYKEEGQKVCVE